MPLPHQQQPAISPVGSGGMPAAANLSSPGQPQQEQQVFAPGSRAVSPMQVSPGRQSQTHQMDSSTPLDLDPSVPPAVVPQPTGLPPTASGGSSVAPNANGANGAGVTPIGGGGAAGGSSSTGSRGRSGSGRVDMEDPFGLKSGGRDSAVGGGAKTGAGAGGAGASLFGDDMFGSSKAQTPSTTRSNKAGAADLDDMFASTKAKKHDIDDMFK